MKKNKIVKKSGNMLIFAGLLVSLLSAALPVKAQQPPGAAQQAVSKILPKLSKEEIDKKIKEINQTVRDLKVASYVVPILIAGAGIIIGLIALGVGSRIGKKIREKITLRKEVFREIKGEEAVEPFAVGGEQEIDPLVVTKEGIELTVEDQKARVRRTLSARVALGALVATPVVMFLLFTGITGVNILTAILMAGELEQMEKEHPGMLTKKQKQSIVQLKNLAKDPVTRGLIKYFGIKNVLKIVVRTAMKENPALGSIIAFGNPKKAESIVKKYIKLKWKVANARKGIDELSAQMTKEKNEELQLDHEEAVAALKKTEKKIKDLKKKHPYLAKSKHIKNALQEFTVKAEQILEGLREPVLEPEIPAVPL